MSLLSGVIDAAKGVANIATAPARTALSIVGTGLSTAASVVGNVAQGDIGGAASAAVGGAKDQIGNVTGYFGENVDSVKQIAGGHLDFLKGGAGLIGTPIRGAARLAGNGLSTAGGATTALAQGDLSGIREAYSNGASNAGHIVTDTASQQVANVF